jgi:hypothetical protein
MGVGELMPRRQSMPPRLKDWKEGKIQIGLFVRTDDGVVEAVSHEATPEAKRAAGLLLLRLIEKKEPSGKTDEDAPAKEAPERQTPP